MKATSLSIVALALSALLIPATPRAQAASVVGGVWTIDYDVELFKKVGSQHFAGSFTFDADSLSGVGKEVLKYTAGVTDASINFKGITYTPASAKAARARFIDGELVGLKFKFVHKGKSTFRVKLGDFVRGSKLRGAVSYDDSAYAAALAEAGSDDGDVVHMPTPTAAAGGMAMLAAMVFKRRRRVEV